MNGRVLLLSVMLGLTSGCAFDLEACTSDEDCPSGTSCGRPAGTGTPMCIAPTDVVPDPNSASDAGTVPDDSDDGVNPIPWPDQNSEVDAPSSPGGECPAVDNCGADEPNDTEDDAIYLSRFAQGCSGFGLEEWNVLHQDSLCAGDVDQFIVEYVPCEDGAFKVTASLTTPDTCSAGGNLEIAESLYNCSDRNVRCEVVDDVERVTIIIYEQPRPRPVEEVRFAVRPGLAADGVTYILRASVGR